MGPEHTLFLSGVRASVTPDILQAGAVKPLIPRTTEEHKLLKKIWINESRRNIINTSIKEGTGKSPLGRAHWVTEVCYYYQSELRRSEYNSFFGFFVESSISKVNRCKGYTYVYAADLSGSCEEYSWQTHCEWKK